MTDGQILEIAREVGWNVEHKASCDYLVRFARAVISHEREECAKVCDKRADEDGWEGSYAHQCAAAIRSRT